MIDNLIGGNGIEVIGSQSGTYTSTTGIVRWNGSSQRLEVMDYNNWVPIFGGSLTISASPSINSVVNWAMIKMAEEEQLKFLMDKHPGLKDTKEKFDVMLALVRNGEFTEDK